MKTEKDEWLEELDYHQRSGANKKERVVLSSLIMVSHSEYEEKGSIENLLTEIGKEDLNLILKSFSEKDRADQTKEGVVRSILSSCIVMVHHWEQDCYYGGLDLLEEALLFYVNNPELKLPEKLKPELAVAEENQALESKDRLADDTPLNKAHDLNSYEKPTPGLDLPKSSSLFIILIGLILMVFILS